MTHASRDTTTGLAFEARVKAQKTGTDLSKYKLYRYLFSKGQDYKTVVSRQFLPDEAYFNEETGEFMIFEKKFQNTKGSADEKIQTCAFKIHEFRKIGALLGATNVSYTYILSDWFKQPRYKDDLEYIKSVPGCSYYFESDN